jgi:hypothetical protein
MFYVPMPKTLEEAVARPDWFIEGLAVETAKAIDAAAAAVRPHPDHPDGADADLTERVVAALERLWGEVTGSPLGAARNALGAAVSVLLRAPPSTIEEITRSVNIPLECMAEDTPTDA